MSTSFPITVCPASTPSVHRPQYRRLELHEQRGGAHSQPKGAKWRPYGTAGLGVIHAWVERPGRPVRCRAR